jgi:diadenosine tetraphosphatase ApaH/serine/threonine PP2A family protein phosphatase
MHDPKNFNYVLGFDDAKSCFENMKKDIAFIGHSHRPEVWIHGMNDPLQACKNTVYLDYKRRYIVNAGSVGQPRDRNSNACYVIYDSDKQTVEFRRVNYNVMRFVEKMLEFEYHGEKFPAKNAVRLNLGG